LTELREHNNLILRLEFVKVGFCDFMTNIVILLSLICH